MVLLRYSMLCCTASHSAQLWLVLSRRGAARADGIRVSGHTSQLAPLRRQAALQRGRLPVHQCRRCRRATVLARRAGPCGTAYCSVKSH